MTYSAFLIKYSEIGIKGKNRYGEPVHYVEYRLAQ